MFNPNPSEGTSALLRCHDQHHPIDPIQPILFSSGQFSKMAGGLVKYRHLSRNSAHRKALLRNLVTSLIEHESITTTWHKAKEAQRLAEKLITLSKRNTIASKQGAQAILFVRISFCQQRPCPETNIRPFPRRNPTVTSLNSSTNSENDTLPDLVATHASSVSSP